MCLDSRPKTKEVSEESNEVHTCIARTTARAGNSEGWDNEHVARRNRPFRPIKKNKSGRGAFASNHLAVNVPLKDDGPFTQTAKRPPASLACMCKTMQHSVSCIACLQTQPCLSARKGRGVQLFSRELHKRRRDPGAARKILL